MFEPDWVGKAEDTPVEPDEYDWDDYRHNQSKDA